LIRLILLQTEKLCTIMPPMLMFGDCWSSLCTRMSGIRVHSERLLARMLTVAMWITMLQREWHF